ncbi:MAG TPA: M56 family metallopeptidase [Candidatus Acidoferrum sp.]|nr:M56 family metallopeptidase [Candidatus Acidoferrum sp.]
MMTNTLADYDLALAFFSACCVKATLLLSCAWLIVIALRQRSSAAQRHCVWAVAILASFALPFFSLLLPAWHSATLSAAAALWSPAHANAGSSISHTIPSTIINVAAASSVFNKLAGAALLAWALGLTFVLLRLLTGLARLAWISAHAKPLFDDGWMQSVLELSMFHKISRPVRLLQCNSPIAMPLTWGVFLPVIVLPSGVAQWSEDRRCMVLSHELAHIARHDWFLQICAELARAIYWFHPLVWLAAARLRQESERASDDSVLRSGIAPSNYASQLLDLARTLENTGRAWSTALAIARPSSLERRFAAMLNPSINRSRLSPRIRLLIPFFALCLLFPLAALHLTAQNLSGKTSGSIHDPSGAGVANATIIMSNQEAKTIDMTTSDREGNFAFKPLPAGNYELQVLKPGFETYRVPQISLDAGRDFTESFTLQVGALTEHVTVVPENSAKPVPVETISGKPSRLSIGGTVQAAKIITRVQPVYPESARSAGISGTVVLHAVIGMDGKPLSLRVKNSQIDPDLARSAVEAVSQWRYSPTLLNGEPIEVDTIITVNYSLAP